MQNKIAHANKKVEVQAADAVIVTMKKFFKINIKTGQAVDKNINYFFNTI